MTAVLFQFKMLVGIGLYKSSHRDRGENDRHNMSLHFLPLLATTESPLILII